MAQHKDLNKHVHLKRELLLENIFSFTKIYVYIYSGMRTIISVMILVLQSHVRGDHCYHFVWAEQCHFEKHGTPFPCTQVYVLPFTCIPRHNQISNLSWLHCCFLPRLKDLAIQLHLAPDVTAIAHLWQASWLPSTAKKHQRKSVVSGGSKFRGYFRMSEWL